MSADTSNIAASTSSAQKGIIGLETAVSLALQLVRDRIISEQRLVELLSVNPARILGVSGGSLALGDKADITVVDPAKQFVFTEESIISKGKNNPFIDWKMTGKAVLTFCEGRKTHTDLWLTSS